MNHGIILHEEYRERMKKFSPERLGLLVQNLFRVDDGEKPLSFPDDEALDVFSEIVCARLERDLSMSEKQRLNRLGKTKQEPKKTKNNQKEPNENQKKPLLPITNNQLPITNKDKKTYGECANVYLTDEEYSKIKDDGLTGLIEELSLYIASKGDKYRSHYAVIRQWANRRKKEQDAKVIRPNQFTSGVQSRDIDFSDLEKRLIKN